MLAVSMYSYVREVQAGAMDLQGFIEEAARIGAEGVELLDFFYKDREAEPAIAKRALEQFGLPCPIFSVANNFAKPDADERLAERKKIEFGVGQAVFLGAKVVRVFAGNAGPDTDLDEATEWIVDGLAACSDFAKEHGVSLALENHGKLAGKGSQVKEIIDRVRSECGHDTLGANPDTGNFVLVDDDSPVAVSAVAPMAKMVHFKDFALAENGAFDGEGGKKFAGTVIGNGQINLAGCIQSLRNAGFDGWFSLEYEGHGPVREEVEQSLANARSLLSNG